MYVKFWKRFFDIVLSVIGLIVAAIPMAIVAIAIKWDSPGPVIFKQQRLGRYGKVYTMYKFRSMCVGAEKGGVYSDDKDTRISRVGMIIRKTSLDELPQLWNVLVGDMSLVGPRPIVRDEIVKYGEYINDFYLVPPGITGVWQVSGRSDTTYEERVLMDSWYVHNWSVWIDIVYLLKTVLAVVKSKGAY